ncbi:hypothetical protein SCA6_015042 [Theobroma cacao]
MDDALVVNLTCGCGICVTPSEISSSRSIVLFVVSFRNVECLDHKIINQGAIPHLDGRFFLDIV